MICSECRLDKAELICRDCADLLGEAMYKMGKDTCYMDLRKSIVGYLEGEVGHKLPLTVLDRLTRPGLKTLEDICNAKG